jgi:alpha-1,6-mannosyltransferase
LAFTVGAWLTPWSWHGQRIVFLLADLGTIAVLVMLLSRLGRPRHWIVFYAWNPLIIKEIANSAHVESLLSLSLSLLVLSCCYWQARPTVARLVWVALAFSAAILSKLYPIMLAPILAVYVWRTARTVRPVLALGAMCLMTGALAYAPFMSVGWARLTEGLRTLSGTWVRNAGIYELLELATPCARFLTATAVVLAALVSAYSVLRARQPLEGMIRAMVWTLLVWFLTLPMVFPWYAIGLLTLCTVQPRLWSVVLSGMLGLYYMLFYNEYNGVSGATTVVVKAVEHAVVIAVLLLESVLLRRGRSLLELANPAADSC